MMAMPTLVKPKVMSDSCHGAPRCPAPVMGDSAAVPKTAASAVNAQLA